VKADNIVAFVVVGRRCERLYVTKATAAQYSLTTISDLNRLPTSLRSAVRRVLAATVCLGHRQQLYGLQFKEVKKLDVVADHGQGAQDGDIQVGLLFTEAVSSTPISSCSRTQESAAADNAIAVWRSSIDSPELKAAIDAVNAKLTTASTTSSTPSCDQKLDPKVAASQWLKIQSLA